MKISILIAVVLLASAPRIAKVDPALLEHWKYDSQVPLNFQQGGLQHRGSVKIYDVTFASPVGDRGKAFRRGRYPFKRKPGRRDGATSCEPITV